MQGVGNNVKAYSLETSPKLSPSIVLRAVSNGHHSSHTNIEKIDIKNDETDDNACATNYSNSPCSIKLKYNLL